MRQCRIVLDAFQLVGDNLFHVGLNPVVVLLNLLLHAVVALFVGEVGNNGDFLVGFLLLFYFFSVHDNWKTRARVTPRADKALTPDIFYD